VAPSDPDTVLRWSERGLLPAGDVAAELLAADSWLVRDGAVRALDAHWQRFGGWCAQLGVAADELARFRAAVTVALPRGPGRWFPRVEARAGDEGVPELSLRLRRAPAASPTVRVAIAPAGDPRTRPRWKGPDLETLIALRAEAARVGAGELLLRDDDGRLLEGALSSLLWWEDDVLCTTRDESTLPGVTRALLLSIAARDDIAVRVRSPRPAELAGCETWLTSALHGIRVVEGWGAATRAPRWRERLDAIARPLADTPRG
jgi:branched-subunit amino acid aminotransferase/4-amino-4-deoxychorismate lyase